MLDNREKKNLLIVILAILCLIGVFVGVRSCTKSDENKLIEDDLTEKPEKEDKPEINIEKPENNKEANENVPVPGTSTDVDKVVVKYKDPVVTMKNQYSVNQNGTIKLPTITVDDNGEKVTTKVSYEFMEIGKTQYLSVLGVDTSKIGTYKVTYKISNGHKTITKVVYVEVVDNEMPVVTANIKEFDDNQSETDIPVLENTPAKGPIYVTFSDNDVVEYAEYYKAKKEIINGQETIEKEGMQEIIEIDPNEELILDEDGEYHVRVTDRSGNTTEFIVIHDETPAVNESQVITDNDTYVDVTVSFNEPMQEIPGWTLSSDKKSLTKSYDKATTEDIYFKDVAGNETPVNIDAHRVLTLKKDGKLLNDGNSINLKSDVSETLKLTFYTNNVSPDEPGKLIITKDGQKIYKKSIKTNGRSMNFTRTIVEQGGGLFRFTFVDNLGNESSIEIFANKELVNG